MIRRLVEQRFRIHRPVDAGALRTPELLLELVYSDPESAHGSTRPAALAGNAEQVESALALEKMEERRRDRGYWTPLKRELEALRRAREQQ